MSDTTVTMDASRVTAMLDGYAKRARGRTAFWPAIQSAAEQGAAMVSEVAHDTGELAGSIHAGGRDGPGLIVSDLDYAPFVFGGTQHMDAQRPNVPADAIAQILAQEVFQAIFK